MSLAEIYAKWVTAGLIVSGIFLLVAWAGGFSSFLTELVIDSALGCIPFPFDLIATWSMSPYPVIVQGIIVLLLIFGIGS